MSPGQWRPILEVVAQAGDQSQEPPWQEIPKAPPQGVPGDAGLSAPAVPLPGDLEDEGVQSRVAPLPGLMAGPSEGRREPSAPEEGRDEGPGREMTPVG